MSFMIRFERITCLVDLSYSVPICVSLSPAFSAAYVNPVGKFDPFIAFGGDRTENDGAEVL
ncbi:unnamed protein product [Periconia digitata]|uniref:Uncharacterized protein n=1 Tax=Periconia digitata TaxID=1303443 RepID=A0A9W4XSX4_9PLEO|nr:unnamed protein product [Periconia digitata]